METALTWEEMKAIEPGLRSLEALARMPRVKFYPHVKPILLRLVGWERGRQLTDRDVEVGRQMLREGHGSTVDLADVEEAPYSDAATSVELWMRSTEAYEIAYETLFDLTSGPY